MARLPLVLFIGVIYFVAVSGHEGGCTGGGEGEDGGDGGEKEGESGEKGEGPVAVDGEEVAAGAENETTIGGSSLNGKGNSDLHVFYKPSLIIFVNQSANMGMILDYSSRLIVDLNGKRGAIIVVDISKQVRYYVKNGTDTENIIWSDSDNYFQKLLQSLLGTCRKTGEKSNMETLDEAVRTIKEEVFYNLGGSLPLLEEQSLLIKFVDFLKGPLSLMYKKNGSFKITSGVDKFIKVNLAVAQLLNYWKGKLTPDDLNLNASQIFKAESGAEVLLTVLSQAGVRFDLMKVFGDLFTSPEKVLSLLKIACSGSYEGLDGLLMVLVNYAELLNGKGSIDLLTSSVLNYKLRPWDGQSLRSLVNQTLAVVANQDRVFHNAPGFSAYVPILNGIIENNNTSNNISISNIIIRLTSRRSKNPLSTLMNELSSIYRALNISDSFSSVAKQFNETLDGGSTTGKSDHQIIYKPFLIAIFNKAARMAVILDYSSWLIVELNGKRGTINVVDISEQVRYYMKNETDTLNSIWSNFEGYFQKLSSLKLLLKTGQEKGEKSKLDTLEGPIRENLEEVINSLGISSSLPEVLPLLTQFIKLLKGPYSLVYKGSGSFSIAGGVEGFIKANLAVAKLLRYSKGAGEGEKETGGGKECGSGGKGGVEVHWELFPGGGRGGAKKPWKGKGHGNVGVGNKGEKEEGNKKGNCGTPPGIRLEISGGRVKAGAEVGIGNRSFHIGREQNREEGGGGSKSVDGGGGNKEGNQGGRNRGRGRGRDSDDSK